jgi:hypothetical protein
VSVKWRTRRLREKEWVMGMTPAVDVLLDVRALLARPGGWIQGSEEAPREQGGSAYCIQGALKAVGGITDGSSRAADRVRGLVGMHIPAFNDAATTTQDDVLNVLDRAIAAEWNGDPTTISMLDGPFSMETLLELQIALRRLAQANDVSVFESFDSGDPLPPAA